MYFDDVRKTSNELSLHELNCLVQELGINQADIALATGITQPHVSRILAGEVSSRAKAYQRICAFVRGRSRPVAPGRVTRNKELIGAISAVWDGSDHQARVLASVIRSLGPLTNRSRNDRDDSC